MGQPTGSLVGWDVDYAKDCPGIRGDSAPDAVRYPVCMDTPLSMTVGAPDSPELHVRGHWPDDEIDWFLELNFNDPHRADSIVLSHLNDGWQDLAKINDDEGAIGHEAIDNDDDGLEGFAERLIGRLTGAAGVSPPAHVLTHFRRAVAEWAVMWRERAASVA